jgi:hypothetical protein
MPKPHNRMSPVSTFRLYLLRAAYLLLAVGGFSISWMQIFDLHQRWELMHGVVVSMLGAMSILALLGIRYPLQMLPLLFWEMTWKTIWLLRVALPLWLSQHMDKATAENVFACSLVIIVVIAVPWRYVFERYVRNPGDPWRPSLAPRADRAAASGPGTA